MNIVMWSCRSAGHFLAFLVANFRSACSAQDGKKGPLLPVGARPTVNRVPSPFSFFSFSFFILNVGAHSTGSDPIHEGMYIRF